jgi:pimeloyl-ACP methyl ester carboxylesterase
MPASPQPRRFSPARLLLAVVLTVASLYAAAIAYLMTQETRLVFQAGRPLGESRPAFPYTQVAIPRTDGAAQFGWAMENPGARTWLLFLHGNSATIASRVNIARYRELRALGLSVFAPEYRGFAGLPGVPSENGVNADARAAFDYLTGTLRVPPARIVIYGWSLGSAVAVDLAGKVNEAAVILEGAPASLVAIGARQYPVFPIRLVMRNPFESIAKVDRVRSPMLFLTARAGASSTGRSRPNASWTCAAGTSTPTRSTSRYSSARSARSWTNTGC